MPGPYEIGSDELRLVVVPEAGARVHSIHAFGQLVTRTPADPGTHHMNPFFWGAYHMLPWCNRVDPGPYSVLGRPFTAPANHTDGTVLHGLEYATAWAVDRRGALHTTGGGAGTGWPWTYTATVTYTISGATLTIAYELTNTSDRTMPAGLGFHPWFRVPTSVQVPSAHVFPDNTDTAVRPDTARGALDLRQPAAVGLGVDASWVRLTDPSIRVRWDDIGVALTMSADDPDIAVAVARPPGLDAVAIELQTHAPAGIRRLLRAEPYALRALAAGESMHLQLTLQFTTTAS